ncbi:hypothetical protein [Halopseudomonas aestusnigri]|uniref:Uncharacterized protein n=1 Tax=Halopseudomonas aestusnigri TaxID=857252 RepID=A0AAQ1G5A6_9GAMM|nr:hypothetical protein [Halopseudomonas aestusnigri]OWL90132.1 hypothetical protein B7O88_04325 [Halopseudomonas aestusnigri]SEF83355.1 hypothetical protein SAMN05216586_10257 [Halopseudomonas aestusnigri]
MDKVLVDRELLAGLVSNDRETRLDAERRMYGVLANQPAEAEGVDAPIVVGVRISSDGFGSYIADSAMGIGALYPGDVREPLTTVSQHERIVASLAWPAKTEQQPEQSALVEALKGMLAIHDEPSGFAGKYGRALDDAIAAQQVKIDQRIAAARLALAAQGDVGA